MSDILEEAKDEMTDTTGPVPRVIVERLIAEVERLLSHQGWDTENRKLQSQLEAVKTERDEIQKTLDFAGTVAAADQDTIKKLEAENAQLNFTVETGVVAINTMANKLTASEKKVEELERKIDYYTNAEDS